MTKNAPGGPASAEYAAAYDAHYSEHDLVDAVNKYRALIEAHPSSEEADYSKSQIRNIMHTVVPSGVHIDSDIAMTLDYLKRSATE